MWSLGSSDVKTKKRWVKYLDGHFTQEDIHGNQHDDPLSVLSTRDIQTKPPLRYGYTPIAMGIKNLMIPSDSEDMKHPELSFFAGGKTPWHCLVKLNILVWLDPEIPLLGICPKETKTYFHCKRVCKCI